MTRIYDNKYNVICNLSFIFMVVSKFFFVLSGVPLKITHNRISLSTGQSISIQQITSDIVQHLLSNKCYTK